MAGPKAGLIGHPQEMVVVQLLVDGTPQRQIAERLGINRNLIKGYVKTPEYLLNRARLERKTAPPERIAKMVEHVEAVPTPAGTKWLPDDQNLPVRPVDHLELMNEWGRFSMKCAQELKGSLDLEARDAIVDQGLKGAKAYWELRKMVGTGVIELESGEIDPVVDRQAALTVAQERHREKWYGKG